MTSTDSNRNLVAALSYSMFFITGIAILLVEKEDKFIRFNAMQSTILFGVIIVLVMLISLVLRPLPLIGVIANVLNSIIYIVALVIWGISMYRAYRGEIIKWPIVGNFAEKKVR